MSYAVIDIGTNTLILLIAKPVRKSLEVIHDEAVITRLGQGLSENHFFLPEAMKRTLDVLKKFKSLCTEMKVDKIAAVGTASFRNAANADVFINRVKKECGFKISVLSGEEEAEEVFRGAAKDFLDDHDKLIVVDIGGGSTEIITGPSGKKGKKRTPETVISLPFGSVRLTELYVRSDPISDEDLKRLCQSIRNGLKDNLDDFYSPAGPPKKARVTHPTLVATAGTATTLLTLDKKMKIYKPWAVHGAYLKKERLEKLVELLATKTIAERQELPGLEPLRADVILAGAILLNEIMSYFSQKEALISDHGLRYGVFYDKFMK